MFRANWKRRERIKKARTKLLLLRVLVHLLHVLHFSGNYLRLLVNAQASHRSQGRGPSILAGSQVDPPCFLPSTVSRNCTAPYKIELFWIQFQTFHSLLRSAIRKQIAVVLIHSLRIQFRCYILGPAKFVDALFALQALLAVCQGILLGPLAWRYRGLELHQNQRWWASQAVSYQLHQRTVQRNGLWSPH